MEWNETERLEQAIEASGVAAGEARRQRSIVPVAGWTNALEVAGADLATCQRVQDRAADGGLSRDDLFALAADSDWAALHLGVLMWGYGTFANLNVAQAARDFVRVDADTRTEICDAAGRSVERAWDLWWPRDYHSNLPGLRVAMGTKLLYFAGYESSPEPRPLIYDRHVAEALRTLGYDAPDPTTMVRWDDHLGPYLVAAERIAASLGIEPEDVEYALFLGPS